MAMASTCRSFCSLVRAAEGSNRVSLPCKRSSDFTNASSVGNTSVMAVWYTRGETSFPAGSSADEDLPHPGASMPRRR